MCPHKFKKGGELLTLATPPRVGPKTLTNPKPTGVGKRGSRGRKPPGRGSWGMSPHKFKRGGELPTLATPPRVGPKTQANPKPTRVGNGGPGGGKAPLAGGRGGCAPKNSKELNSITMELKNRLHQTLPPLTGNPLQRLPVILRAELVGQQRLKVYLPPSHEIHS